jgi:hypothetical protein
VPYEKVQNITAGVASKTMKNLFGRADGKGSVFFGMERAEATVIFTGFSQQDIIGYDFNDICSILDFFNFFFWNEIGQKERPPWHKSRYKWVCWQDLKTLIYS